MELKDTVDWMNSESYTHRFAAEAAQLAIRIVKLDEMLDAYYKGTLDFTPTYPIAILEEQLSHMCDYQTSLVERDKLEFDGEIYKALTTNNI